MSEQTEVARRRRPANQPATPTGDRSPRAGIECAVRDTFALAENPADRQRARVLLETRLEPGPIRWFSEQALDDSVLQRNQVSRAELLRDLLRILPERTRSVYVMVRVAAGPGNAARQEAAQEANSRSLSPLPESVVGAQHWIDESLSHLSQACRLLGMLESAPGSIDVFKTLAEDSIDARTDLHVLACVAVSAVTPL